MHRNDANKLSLLLGAIALVTLFPAKIWARNVFLNGVDISSARHQDMENISLRIDGDGNIFIIAPHYQVNEESTYIPLSSWKHSPGAPQAKGPGVVDTNPNNLPSHPALQAEEAAKPEETPKEGSKSKGEGEEGQAK